MALGELTRQDPIQRSMLLTALYMAQEQYGYLTEEAIERTAERLDMSPAEVFETATFYSMYHHKPVGKYVLQVCEGLTCHLTGGAEGLLDHLEKALGVHAGETTDDGLFTIEIVQCLAACGSSPAMRVNDTLYEHLTLDRVDQILDELRGG